jgi:hypothetical protein
MWDFGLARVLVFIFICGMIAMIILALIGYFIYQAFIHLHWI